MMGLCRRTWVPVPLLALVAGLYLSQSGPKPTSALAAPTSAAVNIIAFLRANDVWAMRPDGSGQTRLTRYGDVGYLAWRPDGREIAFGRPNGIWVMMHDGTKQRLVATTGHSKKSYGRTYRLLSIRELPDNRAKNWYVRIPTFAWMPDGQRIAYASPSQVRLVHVSKKEVSTLTGFSAGWCDEVCGSPNGQYVGLVHLWDGPEEPEWYEALYLWDRAAQRLKRLGRWLGGEVSERQVVSLAFSPDGSRLLYSDVPHEVCDGQIILLDLRTLKAQRLRRERVTVGTDLRGYYFPVWAPSGKLLGCRYDDIGREGLCFGVGVHELASGKWTYYQCNGPFCAVDLSFSPDSRHLAFTNQAWQISILDLSTGRSRTVAENAHMPSWCPAKPRPHPQKKGLYALSARNGG